MASIGLRLCLLMGLLHHLEASPLCGWQKFPDSALYGLNDKVIKHVQQSDCQKACEQEQDFVCASFDYSPLSRSCFLSQSSRHSQPKAFGKHERSDYYERWCDADDDEASGYGSGAVDDRKLCDEGWEEVVTEHSVTCYQIVLDSDKDWAGADAACALRGAHLVAIETEAELDAVTSMVHRRLPHSGFELFWTAGRKSGGSWVWEKHSGSAQPMRFSKWYPGEPNNARGREDVVNLILKQDTWGFNDGYSGDILRYICEKKM